MARPLSEAAGLLTARAEAGPVPDMLDRLQNQLGVDLMALLVIFVSPDCDVQTLARDAAQRFPATTVIGCTTAGEISSLGYVEGEIVAVGFPASMFRTSVLFIDRLQSLDKKELTARTIRKRLSLTRQVPNWTSEFAFLLVDGLSRMEDQLTSILKAALGPTPLFGGSAGDGLEFGETFILHGGMAYRDAAVLALVRSVCDIEVFSFDHLRPTGTKMVVTRADPERRVVHEINAEPAAREYARMVGKDPEQLSPFIFAAHPVVVRVGGRYHVRAIQKVEPNGDLTFFSAIDEGLVLTVAEPDDIASHLERSLDDLGRDRKPLSVLACDCILRRVEATQKQALTAMSGVLARNNVVGFSTYGEQLNAAHVNQTMTGVAIFAPMPEDAE